VSSASVLTPPEQDGTEVFVRRAAARHVGRGGMVLTTSAPSHVLTGLGRRLGQSSIEVHA
jgi:hypothetical protein